MWRQCESGHRPRRRRGRRLHISSEKTHGLAASESDVSRLRLGLVGSWGMALADGGAVTPKLKLGARHDGGDAETGFGVKFGGGLA